MNISTPNEIDLTQNERMPRGYAIGTWRAYFYDAETGEEIKCQFSGMVVGGRGPMARSNGHYIDRTCTVVYGYAHAHDGTMRVARASADCFDRAVVVKLWMPGETEYSLLAVSDSIDVPAYAKRLPPPADMRRWRDSRDC